MIECMQKIHLQTTLYLGIKSIHPFHHEYFLVESYPNMLTMQTNLVLPLSYWLVQLQDPYLLDLLQEHLIHQEFLLLAVAALKACLGLQAPFDLINMMMVNIQWYW